MILCLIKNQLVTFKNISNFLPLTTNIHNHFMVHTYILLFDQYEDDELNILFGVSFMVI